MRLLTIGYSLPNKDIDNYNVLNAPSYFDYDALVVDPQNITEVVDSALRSEKDYEAHDGRPIVNGATTAAAVSIADQVRRRADETRQLLENGGVVIVMGRPNATLNGVIGFEGMDRYSWLPAPAGVAWSPPILQAAEGQRVTIADDQHPLADVMREHRNDLRYRARFDALDPRFRQHAHIIARGGADVPIAVEFPVLAGRVIFVPVVSDIKGPKRMSIAQEFVDAARQLLGAKGEEAIPFWARSVPLPGLEQLEAELDEAERTLREADGHARSVRERHTALASHRQLLYADGPAYREAVRDALATIGFTVTSPPGEPIVVEDGNERAYVEAASTPGQVIEWPYVHVQRRLEEHLLEKGEALKGIIVANAHRSQKPEQRSDRFTEPLVLASQNYRYALLPSEALFALVQRALAGATVDELAPARRRIMRASGLIDSDTLASEREDQAERGPIF